MPEYVKVCSHCGSNDIDLPSGIESIPGLTVNEKCYCHTCGRISVPIMVEKTAQQQPEDTDDDNFQTLSLLPITADAQALAALVTEIGWGEGQYIQTGRDENFESYRGRVTNNPDYSGMMILDLKGIKTGHPDFNILKKAVKHKYNVWLDTGIATESDVFDAFTLDAYRVVCNSLCAASMNLFEEAFALSDHILPCLCLAENKVQWSRFAGEKDAYRAIRMLKDLGYEEIAVIDLDQLGNAQFNSLAYAAKLSETFSGIILGGGVHQCDVSALKEAGLAGAIVEPGFD